MVTSDVRSLPTSAASRARAAVIEPPVSWMMVAPMGLLMAPFRITSDGLRFRICTSVGATVRSSRKVNGTFGPSIPLRVDGAVHHVDVVDP